MAAPTHYPTTYTLVDDTALHCACGHVTRNATAVAHRYCEACRRFHQDPLPLPLPDIPFFWGPGTAPEVNSIDIGRILQAEYERLAGRIEGLVPPNVYRKKGLDDLVRSFHTVIIGLRLAGGRQG